MKNTNLLDSMGHIDQKLIADASPDVPQKKSSSKAWIKWTSLAACFALIVSASLWLFVPGLGTYEQAEIFTSIKLGDVYAASYSQVKDMSNFDKLTLESKIGDLYLETETQKFYKIKGHDDIAQLIAVSDDGDTRLFRFSNMNYWETDSEPFSFGFLLENIFNVKSADDIKSIRFEKSSFSKTDISKKVKVNTVTVTDDVQLRKLFEIFGSLDDTKIEFTKYIDPRSEEYLNGTLPLSIQTIRKVTLEFENGTSIVLQFDPHYKNLRLKNTNSFEGFTEANLNWLIELAEINMEHVDYGTVNDDIKEGVGEVTQTPRPAN